MEKGYFNIPFKHYKAFITLWWVPFLFGKKRTIFLFNYLPIDLRPAF